MECYIKLYPACRHAHAAIDAGSRLRNRGAWDLDRVERICLRTYPAALKSVGKIRVPRTVEDAKFSVTYALARALTTGQYGFDDLEQAKNVDHTTIRIMNMIELINDPSCENRTENIRGSTVELHYVDGTSAVETIRLPKGDPEFPITQEDMKRKIRVCC